MEDNLICEPACLASVQGSLDFPSSKLRLRHGAVTPVGPACWHHVVEVRVGQASRCSEERRAESCLLLQCEARGARALT